EFAARVRRVAARFRCQRMKQETATERIAGGHQSGNEFKILPRLLFRPRGIPWQEGLKSKARGKRGMTIVTAHSAFTPLEKNWLDVSAVFRVAERRLRLPACRRPF